MYDCHQLHAQRAARTCQTMRGDRIDQAVVACFLEAIEPAHLEVALSALEQVEARAKQFDHQWQRQIERAQYEADLARPRCKAVAPDNRLLDLLLVPHCNEKLTKMEKQQPEHSLLPKH